MQDWNNNGNTDSGDFYIFESNTRGGQSGKNSGCGCTTFTFIAINIIKIFKREISQIENARKKGESTDARLGRE